jgi:IPT/TIG domain
MRIGVGLSLTGTSRRAVEPPPTVSSISPDKGLQTGGTAVTITGVGFTRGAGATGATVGGVALTSFAVVNDTTITGTTGAHAIEDDTSVVVQHALGNATLAGAFDYLLDPAALALTGWWQSPFAGSPWNGVASAGASGSRALTEATNPPTVGAALSGRNTADFDPVGPLPDRIGSALALSSFVGASAGSCAVLFNADAAPTANSGAPHIEGNIATETQPNWGITFSTAGVRGYIRQADLAFKSVAQTCATGGWHLVQMKWDGATLYVRLDSGAWSSVAAGPIGNVTGTFQLGRNYASAGGFDGRIASAVTSSAVWTDAEFDNYRKYVNWRNGLSL